MFNKLIIVLLLFLTSCYNFKEFSKNKQNQKIRLVDLQGKSRPIELKTPPQNLTALNKQGNLTINKINSQPAQKYQKQNFSQNKYANLPQNELEKTLAMPTKNNVITSNPPIKYKETEEKKSNNINAFNKQEVLKEVEYDLAKVKEPKLLNNNKKNNITSKKLSVATSNIVKKGYYAQAGSFSNEIYAKKHLEKLRKIAPKSTKFNIQKAKINKKQYYRVLVGPYNYKNSAKSMVNLLKKKKQSSILIKVK